MRYRTGDEIVLKIEDTFGYSDRTFRSVKVQVIGHKYDSENDEAEYLVYVPPYEHIKNSWCLTERLATRYAINRKFIGSQVKFIDASHPRYNHFPAPQGLCCTHCGEFAEGAMTPPDGEYRCRACRLNPYR